MRDPNFPFYVGAECQGLYGPALPQVNRESVKIALVAEKGARDEVRNNRPLIGYTGTMARRHLELAGINPSQVWLTNSVHNFTNPDDNPTRDDIERKQPRLLKELADLPALRVVIAMGEAAMESLTGFHRKGITNWRGSVLPTLLEGVKAVPTFHPSYYSHNGWALGYWKPVVQFDVNRAVKELLLPGLCQPPVRYNIAPSFEQANAWLDWLENDDGSTIIRDRPLLVFDLEMVRCTLGQPDRRFVQWFMSCIGFAKCPNKAFCIPFMYRDRTPYWSTPHEAHLREQIQDLLLNQNKCFSTQGGVTADCWWLRREGIITPYMDGGLDTMYSHRLLAPDLPHALQFLCSIYTRFPFYKYESGKNEKIPVSDEQFWQYNCKDCVTQALVAEKEQANLRETGQWRFFCEEVQSQWPVVSDMIERGFRVDKIAQRVAATRLGKEIEELSHDLDGMIGWSANVKSHLDMEKLLSEQRISIPPSRMTKTHHPKIGEDDLLHYANLKGDDHFKPIASKVIDIVGKRTLLSNFIDMTTDRWGYYHPTYDIAHARTLRLSSSGDDQGPQLQNVPHSLRHIWVPNPGHVLSVCNYKQAKTYVIAWDAEDFFLMEALSKGADVHRVRGSMIFHRWQPSAGLPPADMMATITDVCEPCKDRGEKKCTHSRRFMSKVAGHAFDGMMGIRTFITHELLPRGIFMGEAEARRIRAVVVSKPIERWQARAEAELKQSPWATNAYGLRENSMVVLLQTRLSVRLLIGRNKVSCRVSRIVPCACFTLNPRRRVILKERELLTKCTIRSLFPTNPSLTDWVSKTMDEVCRYPLTIHGRPLTIPIDKIGSSKLGRQK